jgi:tricorn protease
LAIDGVDLTLDINPYRLLRRKGDQRITFLVNQKPVREGAHTVTFSPIGSEEKLRYLAWVERNRAMVDQLSAGKLGYLHLPDMGAEGLREFIKQYYPQRDKDALIIDDRYNGGGNVSSMVLNRLSRKLLLEGFGRTTGFDPYPKALFLGPMVCLLNESSASDGDMFPAAFRQAGLGKLIGKRSWGGIIGITNRGMLMDGGTVNVPEFGHTEPGDKWTIEGHGVDPDIVVDNDLASRLAGKDLQLERGVQELLQELQQHPRLRPVAPPPPVKTGR